ncbi:acyl carrier protein [Micromonospora sp. NPDC048871]|uniref:acyl carrier protein n=1 Tax=unclassified Micromonospora TaxID=2617518 RepID=UPI002E13CD5C|nr:acyl carrier protein [Micromonospora sp. NBC_01739]
MTHEQFGDLGYDSLVAYELVTRLQDGLRISVPDEATDRKKTPQAVVNYINVQLAGV